MEWWMSESLQTYQGISHPSTHPSILEAREAITTIPFIIEDAVGSMLAYEDDGKNERAVYYLSKRFHDYETT